MLMLMRLGPLYDARTTALVTIQTADPIAHRIQAANAKQQYYIGLNYYGDNMTRYV